MFQESGLKPQATSKRQLILRYGVSAFALAALAFCVLQQAHVFHDPKYMRLRPAFIAQDIFAFSWILLMVFLVRKLTRGDQRTSN